MRKISANLILPVSSPPLRNGIIYVNPDGSIADLIDTGGILREESSLEFYPGTITPGFILPWFRLDEYSKSRQDNLNLIEKLERDLLKNGIKGIGLVLPESMVSIEGFKRMSKSSLFFHPVIELCPGRDEDEFEVFNRGIDLLSHAWNEFNLACSLTACSHAMVYSDIGKFIDEYGRFHANIVPPKGDLVPPKGENQFNLLKKNLTRDPEINFEELILSHTMDAAAKIFEEDELGSIEKGKKPGLNLISGYSALDSGQASGHDSGQVSGYNSGVTLGTLALKALA